MLLPVVSWSVACAKPPCDRLPASPAFAHLLHSRKAQETYLCELLPAAELYCWTTL